MDADAALQKAKAMKAEARNQALIVSLKPRPCFVFFVVLSMCSDLPSAYVSLSVLYLERAPFLAKNIRLEYLSDFHHG